jgi:hypothetical protein
MRLVVLALIIFFLFPLVSFGSTIDLGGTIRATSSANILCVSGCNNFNDAILFTLDNDTPNGSADDCKYIRDSGACGSWRNQSNALPVTGIFSLTTNDMDLVDDIYILASTDSAVVGCRNTGKTWQDCQIAGDYIQQFEICADGSCFSSSSPPVSEPTSTPVERLADLTSVNLLILVFFVGGLLTYWFLAIA